MISYDRAVAGWSKFWFAPVPPHIYAVIRILLGLIGLATLAHLADVPMFWALDGLVPVEDSGLGLKAFLRTSPLGAYAPRVLYGTTVAAFVAMTLGIQTSVAVCFALIMSLVQVFWNYLPLTGAQSVMQGLLFCLIWADSGAVWSIDEWLARRRTPDPPAVIALTPIAALRMMRFQIALVYLTTALWKVYYPVWRDGSALHNVLNNNGFHRFPIGVSPEWQWILTLGTYATLFWELFFAVGLLLPATRRLVLLIGVLAHVGMFVSIEVGPFPFVMLTGYVAFLHPRTVACLPLRWRRVRVDES